jgi:hypothetical protein
MLSFPGSVKCDVSVVQDRWAILQSVSFFFAKTHVYDAAAAFNCGVLAKEKP